MGRMNECWRHSLTIDAMGDLTAGYTSHTVDTHMQQTVVRLNDKGNMHNQLQEEDLTVLKENKSY